MNNAASIAFIGAGNMATSLIKGLLQQGYPAHRIAASNRHPDKVSAFKALSIQGTTDNNALLQHDIVVLSVKPQHMKALIASFEQPVRCQILISIAAGITCAQLQSWSQVTVPICRVMPNTPAQLGLGMSALFSAKPLTTQWHQAITQIFEAVGDAIWIEEESQMDAVTALAGSGPAYIFYLLESLTQGGVKLGLSERIAQQLALKVVYGASVMSLSSPLPLSTLRQQVTSKGGTTASGLAVLQEHDFPKLIADTLKAAAERGKTLSASFNDSDTQK